MGQDGNLDDGGYSNSGFCAWPQSCGPGILSPARDGVLGTGPEEMVKSLIFFGILLPPFIPLHSSQRAWLAHLQDKHPRITKCLESMRCRPNAEIQV